MGLREKVQALRERLRRKKEPATKPTWHQNAPDWHQKAKKVRKQFERRATEGYSTPTSDLRVRDIHQREQERLAQNRSQEVGRQIKSGVVGTYQKVQTTRSKIGQATGYFYQAFTGKNPNNRRRRLTKTERKALKKAGYSTSEISAMGGRRSPREPSKMVKVSESRMRQGSMGIQNLRSEPTSQRQGITAEQTHSIDPFSTDAFLPVSGLSEQRTTYLAEPERFKTHQSYGNMDFIGKNSKKGAVSWQYDLSEMFR